MRFLRIMLVLVFVAVAVFYGMNEMNSSASETDEGPVISCSDNVLNVSVKDGRNALLRGVTAEDAQDGNLTDRIIISGVSKLMEDYTANVTYLVFDNDNNMAMHTRRIRYTDYRSPRFSLAEPLNYASIDNVELLDRLHAQDEIDGDITHDIRVDYAEEQEDTGVYTLNVQVTNSMGDTVEMTLPLLIQPKEVQVPEIVLNSYLVYLERGSEFDAESYIEEVIYQGDALYYPNVAISGEVDPETPGTYYVEYSCTRDDVTGRVMLTVVVE